MCDTNLFKISSINKGSVLFCSACLSTDRRLYPLGNYVEVFNSICEFPTTPFSNICLCWECKSVLRKVKLFKTKVLEAQSILNLNLDNKKNPPLKNLSHLTKVNTNQIIYITHEEIDVAKEQIEIKTEIDAENEIPDNVDNNLTIINDIKTENESLVNNKSDNKRNNDSRQKSRHYKYVFEDGTLNKSTFKRIIPIEELELKVVMDNAMKSDIYKSFKYRCKKCVYGWGQKNKLIKHNRKYHDLSNPHSCTICSRCYPDKASLSTHTSTHGYVQECDICSYRCHSVQLINSHLKTHKKTVLCVYCKVCFQNLTQFYNHYKNMHRTFMCDHCNKKCKSKHMLEKHMRRHYVTHECTICNKRYKSPATLRKHMHIHHSGACGEDAYCVPCDKQFRNELVYRRHVLTSAAHDKERDRTKKKIPCPECGNVYSRNSYMMNHYRHVHERRSKHYCTHCHKYFLNRTRYIDHMKYNHEGVKKEKNKLCNICGKGFAANRTLINHVRTHWGERPHVCPQPQCGAAFTQRHAMLYHLTHLHTARQRPTEDTN